MTDQTSGSVTGAVRVALRLEGLAVLALAAYLAGPRIGAIGYNLLHSCVGPVVLAAAFLATGRTATLPLIWAAHVGFDRALGYGLKYPTAFGATHLGAIGRRRPPG